MSILETLLNFTDAAKKILIEESLAVKGLANQLDDEFNKAIKIILNSSSRVVICGMGKSGIIGKKISATLSSTGTPSFFMHPAEAYHGDLGMVASEDIFLALSNSGETDELLKLIPFLKSNGNILISLTGNKNSALALASDHHISVKVNSEACPLQLAPTSSTTALLAMGDAIAISLMNARNFKPENFAIFHPGGSLGRRLLGLVSEEMISTDIQVLDQNSSMLEIIKNMSSCSSGVCIINLDEGFGIITDGDIRRGLDRYGSSIFSEKINKLITNNPVAVSPSTRIEDAINLMEKKSINVVLVIEDKKLLGIFKK